MAVEIAVSVRKSCNLHSYNSLLVSSPLNPLLTYYSYDTILCRDTNTTPQEFRRVLREITFYLGYEATRTMKTADVEIATPSTMTTGKKIAENVAIIPILRAGLGMSDAMLELLPQVRPRYNVVANVSFLDAVDGV